MRRMVAALAAICVLTSGIMASSAAGDTKLRALLYDDEARNWSAVGRVNLGRSGFCSGAMIRTDLVLTAAHCFFDRRTGQRLPDSSIRFVAGYKDGTAQAIRGARRVLIAEGYDPKAGVTNAAIGRDLALIELDQPIVSDRMVPFETGESPRVGEEVAVVSYAQGRATIPSIQEVCRVIDSDGRVLALSCSVTFGASGAPIFAVTEDAVRVVSVVSATASRAGRPISLSVSLNETLAPLLAEASAGGTTAKTTRAGRRSLSEQLGRSGGGVRFIRPDENAP